VVLCSFILINTLVNHSEVHNPSLCFLGIVLVKSVEKVTRLLFEPAIPNLLRFKQRLFLKICVGYGVWIVCLFFSVTEI